jgi:hypothetical protein
MNDSFISAEILLIFFLFFSINLLVSMIKTMQTPPGYIPEDSEWDMPASQDDIDDIIQSKLKS